MGFLTRSINFQFREVGLKSCCRTEALGAKPILKAKSQAQKVLLFDFLDFFQENRLFFDNWNTTNNLASSACIQFLHRYSSIKGYSGQQTISSDGYHPIGLINLFTFCTIHILWFSFQKMDRLEVVSF
jgi:hypothetical protein